MVEHPILFSGPMVRAILSGAKTQTRRVVKPQPQGHHWEGLPGHRFVVEAGAGSASWVFAHSIPQNPDSDVEWIRCPFGAPGDLLWVRETWRADDFDDTRALYAADMPADALAAGRSVVRWRPSIHMPRGRSRITLRVTSVRVERLHAITEEDARAEGVLTLDARTGATTPRERFADLWGEINGRESWDADPWVWVVGFERAEVSRG